MSRQRSAAVTASIVLWSQRLANRGTSAQLSSSRGRGVHGRACAHAAVPVPVPLCPMAEQRTCAELRLRPARLSVLAAPSGGAAKQLDREQRRPPPCRRGWSARKPCGVDSGPLRCRAGHWCGGGSSARRVPYGFCIAATEVSPCCFRDCGGAVHGRTMKERAGRGTGEAEGSKAHAPAALRARSACLLLFKPQATLSAMQSACAL